MRKTKIEINVYDEYFDPDYGFMTDLAKEILEELGQWTKIRYSSNKDPLLGIGETEEIRLPK